MNDLSECRFPLTPWLSVSVRKPELQPFVALIRRGCDVLHPLFLGHRLPLPVPAMVAPTVVRLGGGVDGDVAAHQGQEHPVAGGISWRVAFLHNRIHHLISPCCAHLRIVGEGDCSIGSVTYLPGRYSMQ